ncbi:LacI family DNA-binding transcriptional regulator [Azospirillum picis]|uniref:DNA-binding LacI/PurR family transcriptional regulator n=1 Tax=Azospirillum picis TaxID=488438 RepID=A0ABU0MVB2_9PROT|nr:LacI family DNA-binding transcriptional regulator [Azospirillum picis]MBP2303596.1 DNA-binding LacI/PurR family transcriptional regulator [Azospirillum picis]MDQ0537433.1 DNA-binding LacI/PurR family transcriptional regulator [Azospirillum picis]
MVQGGGRVNDRVATIRDVAARAGVSIATVSRVLNGSGNATPETTEKVRAAASALAFRPSTIGRSLKAARTRTVGVLVPSLSNPVFAESVAGIQQAAAEAGYSVLIASTDYDPRREARAIESLLSNRVEGLVLTVADADRSGSLDTLDEVGLPYVLVYNQPETTARAHVSVDNIAAARAVVERMMVLGHRRIGMVAGRFHQSDRSRRRHRGWQAALADAGLAPGPVVEVDFNDLRLNRRLAPHFDGPDHPTALFASNDLLALATIRALRDLGLSVPGDVSVCGFDGIEVGMLMSPSLATLVQPTRAMGCTAFEYLRTGIAGHPKSRAVMLPFILRPGESLGPAPSREPRAASAALIPDRRLHTP